MDRERRKKHIREEWFKDSEIIRHRTVGKPVGVISKTKDEIEELIWGKPETNINRVCYLRRAGTLCVTGDLGDAIYQWGQIIDLRWIAGLNLDYFASKCVASETGRGYKSWHETTVLKALDFHFQDEDDEHGQAMKGRWQQSEGVIALGGGEGEWKEWLRHDGHEVFGDDWWDMGLDGMDTSIRCEGHLIGLKMALLE